MYHLFLAMGQPNGQGGSSMVSTLIMFGSIFLIFYFMIIRPQQKRQKEREALLNSLQKGDKVVSNGGIHGTVTSVEEKTVIVQVADNVKLKFEKSAITAVTAQNKNQAQAE
jgi:preprotein translocase subunit YajC